MFYKLLLVWIKAVTEAIVYQPDVPQAHKEDIVTAFSALEKEIKSPTPFKQ